MRGSDDARQAGHSAEGTLVLRTPGSLEVLIRGGVFRMGSEIPEIALAQAHCRLEPLGSECASDLFANEMVVHTVMLSDFWMDRYEVTNAAYRRCVDAGVCAAPSHSAGLAWTSSGQLPVTLVSWYDANDYCRWRGARLPTEAEWERAARGYGGRTYPWGDVFNRRICNHGRFSANPLDDSDGYAELAPVGSFPQGRTQEGLHDMAGNVEEWVADWYQPNYPEADMVNPTGPGVGDERVVRGGSYLTARGWVRGATREHDIASARLARRGFRCARDHGAPKTANSAIRVPPTSPSP
jgi:formylglycine-generating enzyme required for sulfatase activity